MKKKILALTVLMAFTLTGCGETKEVTALTEAPAAQTVESAEKEAAEATKPQAEEAAKEEKEEQSAASESTSSAETEEKEEEQNAEEDSIEKLNINEVSGNWSAYYGMFIEVEERDMSEEQMLSLYKKGEAVPMRELWISYRADTGEYNMNISLGNEQLWGMSKTRPDGVTPIDATWFDVGGGDMAENLGSYPFYALLSGDGRHVYMSYDYAGDMERTAAPVSEGTGETFVLLGITTK